MRVPNSRPWLPKNDNEYINDRGLCGRGMELRARTRSGFAATLLRDSPRRFWQTVVSGAAHRSRRP